MAKKKNKKGKGNAAAEAPAPVGNAPDAEAAAAAVKEPNNDNHRKMDAASPTPDAAAAVAVDAVTEENKPELPPPSASEPSPTEAASVPVEPAEATTTPEVGADQKGRKKKKRGKGNKAQAAETAAAEAENNPVAPTAAGAAVEPTNAETNNNDSKTELVAAPPVAITTADPAPDTSAQSDVAAAPPPDDAAVVAEKPEPPPSSESSPTAVPVEPVEATTTPETADQKSQKKKKKRGKGNKAPAAEAAAEVENIPVAPAAAAEESTIAEANNDSKTDLLAAVSPPPVEGAADAAPETAAPSDTAAPAPDAAVAAVTEEEKPEPLPPLSSEPSPAEAASPLVEPEATTTTATPESTEQKGRKKKKRGKGNKGQAAETAGQAGNSPVPTASAAADAVEATMADANDSKAELEAAVSSPPVAAAAVDSALDSTAQSEDAAVVAVTEEKPEPPSSESSPTEAASVVEPEATPPLTQEVVDETSPEDDILSNVANAPLEEGASKSTDVPAEAEESPIAVDDTSPGVAPSAEEAPKVDASAAADESSIIEVSDDVKGDDTAIVTSTQEESPGVVADSIEQPAEDSATPANVDTDAVEASPAEVSDDVKDDTALLTSAAEENQVVVEQPAEEAATLPNVDTIAVDESPDEVNDDAKDVTAILPSTLEGSPGVVADSIEQPAEEAATPANVDTGAADESPSEAKDEVKEDTAISTITLDVPETATQLLINESAPSSPGEDEPASVEPVAMVSEEPLLKDTEPESSPDAADEAEQGSASPFKAGNDPEIETHVAVAEHENVYDAVDETSWESIPTQDVNEPAVTEPVLQNATSDFVVIESVPAPEVVVPSDLQSHDMIPSSDEELASPIPAAISFEEVQSHEADEESSPPAAPTQHVAEEERVVENVQENEEVTADADKGSSQPDFDVEKEFSTQPSNVPDVDTDVGAVIADSGESVDHAEIQDAGVDVVTSSQDNNNVRGSDTSWESIPAEEVVQAANSPIDNKTFNESPTITVDPVLPSDIAPASDEEMHTTPEPAETISEMVPSKETVQEASSEAAEQDFARKDLDEEKVIGVADFDIAHDGSDAKANIQDEKESSVHVDEEQSAALAEPPSEEVLTQEAIEVDSPVTVVQDVATKDLDEEHDIETEKLPVDADVSDVEKLTATEDICPTPAVPDIVTSEELAGAAGVGAIESIPSANLQLPEQVVAEVETSPATENETIMETTTSEVQPVVQSDVASAAAEEISASQEPAETLSELVSAKDAVEEISPDTADEAVATKELNVEKVVNDEELPVDHDESDVKAVVRIEKESPVQRSAAYELGKDLPESKIIVSELPSQAGVEEGESNNVHNDDVSEQPAHDDHDAIKLACSSDDTPVGADIMPTESEDLTLNNYVIHVNEGQNNINDAVSGQEMPRGKDMSPEPNEGVKSNKGIAAAPHDNVYVDTAECDTTDFRCTGCIVL